MAENNIFEGIKKIYLIGIGGIGMSGIAEYLAKKGFEVSGSDLNMTHITRRLLKFDVKIFEGHEGSNLPDDTELVIYSAAVNDDNEELKKAISLKMKMVKRAEALGSIVNDKFVIAVSGTHGKTTTTAMIAKSLIESKIDPTVFVGGNIDYLDGGSSRIGKSNVAVVEADEYDRSFLQLRSNIIIVTNIDADHLDVFKDIDDIKDNFRKFIERGKPNCKVIGCGDNENVVEVIKDLKNKTTYGFKKSNEHIVKDVNYQKKSSSYVLDRDYIDLKVLGDHNILNSAAAYLACKEYGITDEGFTESMKTFTGVKRRLELKYSEGIKIYDDYAHHPEEVKATLSAMKRITQGRIVTVFQPHLYTRTRDFYKQFGEAFSGTDVLLLAKIYPAREKEIEGVSSEMILEEYKKSGRTGLYIEDKEKILDELESIIKDDDVIVFQGAGDITDLCTKFVKRMKAKSGKGVPL